MTPTWASLKSWDGRFNAISYNKLIDAVQSLVIQPGVNYTITRSPGGTTLVTSGKGAGGASSCPFAITLIPVTGDPTSLTVKVSPGTVNQFVATNIFDSFSISSTGTYYVKAGIESDGDDITSWTLYVDSSEPDEQNATPSSRPTSFDVLIAIIKDGKVYRTLGCGSIVATSVEAFRTDKAAPAGPGELTYIPYYVWQISVA